MSEPVWVPLGASGLPKAVYPIDFRNPQVASNAGNSYPLVSSLTGWEEWAWAFSATATGYVFGVFRLPENVPSPATATMKFDLASAGAGNAVIFATLKGIADGETLNIASWDWSSQVTVPLVARTRKIHAVAGVTIPAILAPGDFCVAAFARLGADAADTLASPLELLYGALVID